MTSKQKQINIILIYIFVFSVFIDIYNGYIQQIKETESILPNLYKGIVFIGSFPYLFVRNKYGKIVRILTVLCILAFCYWGIKGYIIDIGLDIKQLIKIFYAYSVMLFLMGNRRYIEKEQLINYVILYGVLAAASLLITNFLGIAVHKYGENYGFGIKGFFKAGNDISLILLMCNCLACYMFIQTTRIYYLISNSLLTISGILIGTVAGVYGSTFIIACLVSNGLLIKNRRKILKKWQKLYFGLIIIVAIPILYNVIHYITTFDKYNTNKFSTERLISGGAREELNESANQIIDTYTIGDIIFGRGSSQIHLDMGKKFMNLFVMKTIETDHYELFCSYGLLFGGLLLFIPVLVAIRAFIQFYKYRIPFYFWSSLTFMLFLLHAFMAGHAYTNLYAMQILVVLYFCYEYE